MPAVTSDLSCERERGTKIILGMGWEKDASVGVCAFALLIPPL